MKALSIIILISYILNAGEIFDDLQIDNKNCNLVFDGTNNQKILYKGKKKSKLGMCFINISTEEFNKKYSFCTLSGIISQDKFNICEFGYYNKEHTKISFTSSLNTLCEFTCIKK